MKTDLHLLDAPYIDLLYHALAHMKVSNASNLCSEAYIQETTAGMPSAKALREKWLRWKPIITNILNA